MVFDLSFSPEFFLAEGEPYDISEPIPEKPYSVWQAIEAMREREPEDWDDMVEELFGCAHDIYLPSEEVLRKIEETNTCTSLSSPVEVWIDQEGRWTVRVWDKPKEKDNG